MRPIPERRSIQLHQQVAIAFAVGSFPGHADLDFIISGLGFTLFCTNHLLNRHPAKGNDTAAPFPTEDAALVTVTFLVEFSKYHGVKNQKSWHKIARFVRVGK